jgi:signal transduction histidine kinase
MSLRAKLITLFALLVVTPIVALGVVTYIRSLQAVEDLVATRTLGIAQRAADEIRGSYALRQSDLLLLAENAETQRLYRAHGTGNAEETQAAQRAADEYLQRAWQLVGGSYRFAEFRDVAGASLFRLGSATGDPAFADGDQPIDPTDILFVTQPIRDLDSGNDLGTLRAAVRLRTLLPDDALQVAFGRSGYSAVVDRSTGRVLYHPRRAYFRQPLSMLIGPDGWSVSEARLAEESGRFTYEEADSTRVASFAALAEPPWTIVATASVAEFAPPFARTRLINLALILLAAVVISVAFLLVTKRMTRSLGALTSAADDVARGNFEPDLPPAGADEVGKLSGAFGLMVHQVRDMLHRIQESRHMAAVGAFASQLSHEIRNPLTSIKLNLQSLERDVSDRRIPEEYAGPINICLREVKRLDRVAGGVLSVARTRPPDRVPCSVHDAVREGLETLTRQLESCGIHVQRGLEASSDTVVGDAEQLKGVFLNLFLNAVDAMPQGGSLEVVTKVMEANGSRLPRILIRVADTGGGIPPEIRDRIFDPFVSTKEEGTGFGLALAQQAVEEHEGTLRLEEDAARTSGAVFVVELPLAREDSA